jgi:transposase
MADTGATTDVGQTVRIAVAWSAGYAAPDARFCRSSHVQPAERFVLLKWRWIVERTFGWLNLSRRLSEDYAIAGHQ